MKAQGWKCWFLLKYAIQCCVDFLHSQIRPSHHSRGNMRYKRMLKWIFTVVILVLIILLFLGIINWIDLLILYSRLDTSIVKPTLTPLENLPKTGRHKIPRIIHQTWKSENIPVKVVEWVRSWKEHHPGWEYWFWTDKGAHEFIAKKYPNFLSTYVGYQENIRRADAMRYFILYEYGGIYADTDIEVLKPLDPLTFKYSCFLGREPPEHSLLDTNADHLAINAIMGCRAKHPFFKQVIEQLPNFAHMWDLLDSTGPHFITAMYNGYQQKAIPAVNDDGVYLTPSEYFIPTVDPMKPFYMRNKCKHFEKLTFKQKGACISLYITNLREKAAPYSFTEHHWIHTYLSYGMFVWYSATRHISDIIPDAKIMPQPLELFDV